MLFYPPFATDWSLRRTTVTEAVVTTDKSIRQASIASFIGEAIFGLKWRVTRLVELGRMGGLHGFSHFGSCSERVVSEAFFADL